MGKVIRFELKKLVSRIGIYVLVLLMAGLLVVSALMYEPTERPSTTLSLVGETVSEMYENFDTNLKQDYKTQVENIATDADTYVTTSAGYMNYNKEEVTKLFTEFDAYCLLYAEANATESEYQVLLAGINESFNTLKTALNTALGYTKEATGYYILTTNGNYTKLYTTISDITLNFEAPLSHTIAGEKYYSEYRSELISCLNKLMYPNLNDTAVKYTTSGTFYSIITLRMEEIEIKMANLFNKVQENPDLEKDAEIKAELNALFNRYVNCASIFEKSYNSAMLVNALYSVNSKTDRSNLVGYSKVSLYDMEETMVEYEYYIEHHSNPEDFANSLSVTHTSNYKANAYDFTFFVMSIFSVVVIIYAIYLSSHTIAGEINNNTMRLTAMRPVKRGSLFFGKYFAIVIMSLILLAFGTIASFITGAVMFGTTSANILMIINSSFVIVAHPAVVLTVFILSLLLLTMLYSAFAIMLSSLFKSDLLTMIVSVLFYIANLILPLFFGAGSWLKFYPFVNINLFSFFGTTRLTSDSVLAKIFNNVVYHGMSMWISLIYIIGITTLVLLIGKTLFKKRDL